MPAISTLSNKNKRYGTLLKTANFLCFAYGLNFVPITYAKIESKIKKEKKNGRKNTKFSSHFYCVIQNNNKHWHVVVLIYLL